MMRRNRRARMPETQPYDEVPRRGAKSGEMPSSKYGDTLDRHRGQRRMRACTALGRAAEHGARQRRAGEVDLGWQRPSDASGVAGQRPSAFAPPCSGWPALSLSDAPLDVGRFEEMLLIRDERGMRVDGSKYLEQLAKEYPDEPHRVVLAARRVLDVFSAPIPLTDRALITVVRHAVALDFRTAMDATRLLILQYPKSPHTPTAMLAAASIQRRAGRHDKSLRTLNNLVEAYPSSSAAGKAMMILSA